MTQIKTPTGPGDDHHDFHHLMPHLRLGKVSGETFSRKRLADLPVDYDVREHREVVKDAAEKLRAGRAKGVSSNGGKVRHDGGGKDFSGKGKRARNGKDAKAATQLDVQNGSAPEVEAAKQRKRQAKVKKETT
jgi:hypothetical protein